MRVLILSDFEDGEDTFHQGEIAHIIDEFAEKWILEGKCIQV